MAVGVSAASVPAAPAWEPDANAASPYGNLTFYNASGAEVTSGTNDLTSPFAYVVASTAADTGATKATVNFYNPQPGVVPGNWTGTAESGTTTFDPASSLPSGTPADLVAYAPTYPVSAASTADISTWLSSNSPSTTSGYANIIQVRLTDSGPYGAGNNTGTYWEADIGYNTTSLATVVDGTSVPADGWAQLFPLISGSSTSLEALPASPQAPGTQITLKATVTPSTAAGVVQFYDNGTFLADSTTPGSGSYTYAYTPAAGDHSYTADFVPNLGDETGADSTTATIIGGSASTTVPFTIGTSTVTVTKFAPTPLGQGASNIAITVTGTGFVTDTSPTITVDGVSFSSATVVNSTTITAKATVESSATVGAATVGVTDSSNSGNCTSCLTIVAGPTVKSLTPSPVVPGASKAVTITGTGFMGGASIAGPAGVKFTKGKVVSSTKFTATMTVASSAKVGKDLAVTVINNAAGGYGEGTGKVLTIVANPTVKAMSPSKVSPGKTYSVTIGGTGFVAGLTLIGPAGVTFTKGKILSSDRFTAVMKVASNAKAGKDLSVTVVNSAAGGGGRGTGKVLTIS